MGEFLAGLLGGFVKLLSGGEQGSSRGRPDVWYVADMSAERPTVASVPRVVQAGKIYALRQDFGARGKGMLFVREDVLDDPSVLSGTPYTYEQIKEQVPDIEMFV